MARLTVQVIFCDSVCQSSGSRGAPTRGVLLGFTPPPQSKIKETHLVGAMISKVIRYLRFNRNEPLKSADDEYTRIFKNKMTRMS
jgi:hypothetical protein